MARQILRNNGRKLIDSWDLSVAQEVIIDMHSFNTTSFALVLDGVATGEGGDLKFESTPSTDSGLWETLQTITVDDTTIDQIVNISATCASFMRITWTPTVGSEPAAATLNAWMQAVLA